MTGKISAAATVGAKLLFAAALLAIGVRVAGVPARAPGSPQASVPLPASRITHPVAKAAIAAPTPVDERFVVKRILALDAPLEHGDYAWDDRGVPAGPLVITVDLAAQVLSVFRDGYEIGTAAILYGADNKPTPLGVFPITQKDAHHISNLYNVPMPYMLRLTNDGVSIHGSQVEWNKGTSGCIGVPVPFAALLFRQARLGDRVFITKGKLLHLGEAITNA